MKKGWLEGALGRSSKNEIIFKRFVWFIWLSVTTKTNETKRSERQSQGPVWGQFWFGIGQVLCCNRMTKLVFILFFFLPGCQVKFGVVKLSASQQLFGQAANCLGPNNNNRQQQQQQHRNFLLSSRKVKPINFKHFPMSSPCSCDFRSTKL